MKYLRQILPATAVAAFGLALGSIFATACLADKTKPQVLFPAAELAWPAVQEDYTRGLQDGVSDGDLPQITADLLTMDGQTLGKALKEKDLPAVKMTSWPTMEPWAQRGIQDKLDDQEIGTGVATSLREQLTKFTDTIVKLQAIK